MMAENAVLERMLLEADPARTSRDARPDAAAIRTRDRIIREAARAPRRRRRTLGWATGLAVAASAAVVAVVALQPHQQAVAGSPEPLDFEGAQSISQTLETARQTLGSAPGPVEPMRTVRSASWGYDINMTTGETKVVPALTTLTWEPDLSGRITTVAGTPYAPDDAEANTTAEVSSSGEIVSDVVMGPGEFTTPVVDPPGATRDELFAMLRAYGMPESPSGSEVVGAIQSALGLWMLTNDQEATLLGILADAGGAEPLGVSTDRLGRSVSGLRVLTDRGTASDVVLLSRETGRIVGVERTVLADEGYVPPGAILSYQMWDVDEGLVR